MSVPPERNGADAGAGNLALRIISAVVLAPVVLAIAYVGGWPFLVLCALGAAGILWEWTHLIAGRSDARVLAPGWAALCVAPALSGGYGAAVPAGAIALGAACAAVATAAASGANRLSPAWTAGGVLYAGAAFFGPAMLRRDADLGFLAFLFLAATVWMTDICAFFVGRGIGGPLLWPSVSPKKTWSGALGGLAGGVAGGMLVAYASGVGRPAYVGVVALVLSVLVQAGDLFESAVKRRFGAKDASRIIPGHGGLMDRLDGFLFAALGAVIIGMLHHGTGAPARGLLVW